jgi:hypothetical protein
MKKRYIFFTIIAIYLIIVVVATIFVIKQEPETENPSTPTATATPTVQKTPCETDRDAIQEALNAYNEANDDWPTANGQPGDIVWDKLVPEYMSTMPVIDSDCDWQVSGNPEGNVCVAHTC